MRSEWAEVRLDEVALEVTVGYVGPMATEYVETGIPFYRSLNIEPFRFNKNDLKFITKEFHRKIKKSALRPGEVVIVRTGKPGTCAVVPPSIEEANCSDLVIVRPGANLDPYYLCYFVNSLAKHHVASHAVGAVQQHFNVASAKAMRLRLPDIKTQREIAGVLAAFDDKIELNRRMNATLEQMAQALFKSWFVDFDPVKAKAEGRSPEGMDAETAALFPSEFEESEMGPIPKGWQRRRLPECIDFLEGPGIRNWQYTNSEEGTRFINIRCIIDRDIVLDTASRISDEEAHGKYRHFLLSDGDLVVSTSGTLGRFAIVRVEHLPLMLNTSVIRMRPVSGITTTWYVYGYIASEEFQQEIQLRASGSVQKNFGPMHLKQMKILSPASEVIQAHAKLAKPIFDKFIQNQIENSRLKNIRDALLPRLISGHLRIPEAEAMAAGEL